MFCRIRYWLPRSVGPTFSGSKDAKSPLKLTANAPENTVPKRKVVSLPPFCWGYVSFREGKVMVNFMNDGLSANAE